MDYEDNHRHCGGLGHGGRPRVRADRHARRSRAPTTTQPSTTTTPSTGHNAAGHKHDPTGDEHDTGH